ncbi:hypothetical protein [Shewanella sp. MBTL60-007]|uniref:hypothetical protein n=1 Tax=Shewanella sp. MBTL60-007 TaxID=2815911 RepID=UPI001BC73278|nr:hypothetical protein [Shewanella sp. MBTL60-007]GIU22274.1 hypothetical protein TUM3792_24210 [Shewanella sp. MBTL60-007]
MRALLLVSICLFAAPAMSEVYRCADGVYQSDPCDESSKPVDLDNGSSMAFVIPKQREMIKFDTVEQLPEQAAAANAHPCKKVKIDSDAIRFRQLTTCMTESQMLKAAGPQQYNVYEYFKEGRHYKEYRFTEPRAGFGSFALVEGGYVVDAVSSQTLTNSGIN